MSDRLKVLLMVLVIVVVLVVVVMAVPNWLKRSDFGRPKPPEPAVPAELQETTTP